MSDKHEHAAGQPVETVSEHWWDFAPPSGNPITPDPVVHGIRTVELRESLFAEPAEDLNARDHARGQVVLTPEQVTSIAAINEDALMALRELAGRDKEGKIVARKSYHVAMGGEQRMNARQRQLLECREEKIHAAAESMLGCIVKLQRDNLASKNGISLPSDDVPLELWQEAYNAARATTMDYIRRKQPRLHNEIEKHGIAQTLAKHELDSERHGALMDSLYFLDTLEKAQTGLSATWPSLKDLAAQTRQALLITADEKQAFNKDTWERVTLLSNICGTKQELTDDPGMKKLTAFVGALTAKTGPTDMLCDSVPTWEEIEPYYLKLHKIFVEKMGAQFEDSQKERLNALKEDGTLPMDTVIAMIRCFDFVNDNYVSTYMKTLPPAQEKPDERYRFDGMGSSDYRIALTNCARLDFTFKAIKEGLEALHKRIDMKDSPWLQRITSSSDLPVMQL